MALPEKHELLPDLLYLFVLGPCKGETVLLRVPPGHWMVIDSFQVGRPHRPAAEPIITQYGGRVEVLALTHPHADHFEGFIDLIDRYNEAMLGCVYPRDSPWDQRSVGRSHHRAQGRGQAGLHADLGRVGTRSREESDHFS